jgi:hypothetical protein
MACAGAGAALYLCPVYGYGDTTRRLAYRYIHVYVHEFIMCQYRVCCIVYFSAASLSRIISYCTAYTYYIYIHTILYIYIYIYIRSRFDLWIHAGSSSRLHLWIRPRSCLMWSKDTLRTSLFLYIIYLCHSVCLPGLHTKLNRSRAFRKKSALTVTV